MACLGRKRKGHPFSLVEKFMGVLFSNKIRTPTFHKIRTPTFKIEKFMGGMFFSASQAISQKGEFFDKKTSN